MSLLIDTTPSQEFAALLAERRSRIDCKAPLYVVNKAETRNKHCNNSAARLLCLLIGVHLPYGGVLWRRKHQERRDTLIHTNSVATAGVEGTLQMSRVLDN